jgi:hypothetical protein
MFSAWLSQLKEQFNSNVFSSLWKLITGGFAVLITVLLMIGAYMVFAVALVVFGFFYTLYGCVLYVIGPLVLALLCMSGIGGLGTSFATNLFIWNTWGVLYAIFGSLITAIHMNDINSMFSTGFAGFFVGTLDSLVLGIVSIFYAASILLIPKIAKNIVAGDVGVTVSSMARTGAAIAATVISVIGGASAGGGAASGSGAGAGASGGAGAGAGASAGASATGGATSSSSPPPQPSLAGTITSGITSAVGGDAPASSSNGSGNGSSSSTRNGGSSESSSSARTSQDRPQPFHSGSVVQTAAFHTARLTSQMVHKALSSPGGNKDEEENEG